MDILQHSDFTIRKFQKTKIVKFSDTLIRKNNNKKTKINKINENKNYYNKNISIK